MDQSMISYNSDMERYQREESQRRANLFCSILNYFMTEKERRKSTNHDLDHLTEKESIPMPIPRPTQPPPSLVPPLVRKSVPNERHNKPPSMDYTGPLPISKKKKKKKPVSTEKVIKKKTTTTKKKKMKAKIIKKKGKLIAKNTSASAPHTGALLY